MQGRFQGIGKALVPAGALAVALALAPSSAFAAGETFNVDTTADTTDVNLADNLCDADAGAGVACSLRAAIQEANDDAGDDDAGDADTINFSAGLFNKELVDTIDLSSALPTIIQSATIKGSCNVVVFSPCAGLDSPGAGQSGLAVSADDVAISDISVTNAHIGIDVAGGAPITGLSLANSWVGVKLDGTAGPNTFGVFLDPNVQGAQIGESSNLTRNVIANSSNTGIKIFGGDQNRIEGNNIGVAADGTTQMANGQNIVVAGNSVGPDQANANVIGGPLGLPDDASPACDGACNVVSGAAPGDGINLSGNLGGELPAANTEIRSNHIGLNVPGTGAVANAARGVNLGSGDGTLVFDNAITGGTAGVLGLAGADSTAIDQNFIGTNSAGMGNLSPPGNAIDLGQTGSVAGAEVTNNRIAATTLGIFVDGEAATVSGNSVGLDSGGNAVSGGTEGIFLYGNANVVDGNTVVNSTTDGILLRGSDHTLTRNVLGSTAFGLPGNGIRVTDGGGALSIGTSDPLEANTIQNVDGSPIVVDESAGNATSVGINTGAENGDIFLDLGADGFGNGIEGPNLMAQPPRVKNADRSDDRVSGTGVGNAIVRVYRSEGDLGDSPTGLLKFLGSKVVKQNGTWKLNPPGKLKKNSRVSANQTLSGNSSEFGKAKPVKP